MSDTPDPEVPETPAAFVNGAGIGTAIFWLRNGFRVRRACWNGADMWLHLQIPDMNSKMTLPYIYMKTADDQLVPWLASQTDILSFDWEVVVAGEG